MCAAFASTGAEVKLVTQKPDNAIMSATDLQQYYNVRPNFKIEQLPRSNGPRSTDMFQVKAILNKRGESKLCYTRGRDVTAAIVGLVLGMHSVIEIHGKPVSLREQIMLRFIQLHPRGMLVAITSTIKNIYTNQLGFGHYKWIVAPGGVDASRFNPNTSKAEIRSQLNMEPGTWLVYVGGLYEGRGLDILFESVAKLDVKVMVVGGRNSEEIHNWKHKARTLAAHNVHFSGYQAPKRVPLYLAASDMLVMTYDKHVYTPSGEETSSWASPMKMFEYMAASRPIIASDIPMLNNTLIDEHNALLVTPGDSTSLRTAITRLINNPALGHHIATNASIDVVKHTWINRAQHIMNQLEIR
ncbi:MAG: glycosyltransferase family 4 protein [Anaerolineales bacterium]|nr:glycosyltransferase family 4 protein [Anaerolineales bacterium]